MDLLKLSINRIYIALVFGSYKENTFIVSFRWAELVWHIAQAISALFLLHLSSSDVRPANFDIFKKKERRS